jgi:hypothetical protein
LNPRLAIIVGVAMVLGGAGCDPVRAGYFRGSFPPPVKVLSLVNPVDPTTNVTSPGLSGLLVRVTRYRRTRRWFESYGDFGVDGFPTSTAQTYQVPLWEALALGLDDRFQSPTERMEAQGLGPVVVFGALGGVADYLFVASSDDTLVQPVGASGPAILMKAGFQILHRTCEPSEPNQFQLVPADTTVTYDPSIAAIGQNEVDPPDPFVESCHLADAVVSDLGDVAAVLPTDPVDNGELPVTDFVWSPASDAVYMLAGTLGKSNVEVLRVKIGEVGAAQLAFGDLYGPLEMANAGMSLLLNQAQIDFGSNGTPPVVVSRSYRMRESFVGTTGLSSMRIPGVFPWPGESINGVLSPDGATLAVLNQTDSYSSSQTEVVDVVKAVVSVTDLGPGLPLAWEPGGRSLLVGSTNGEFSSLSMDGTINPVGGVTKRGFSPDDSSPVQATSVRYFWTASGPQILTQGTDGAVVYNIATGVTTELVEADRVAPPLAPVGIVVATDQVFAWAPRCVGLAETSCDAELRRLSLATGTRDVVARADRVLPFAVSPDGTKIALADSKNVYIKTISPGAP